ncbi:MAG: hypothetical protein K0Q85_1163 [Caproiciproducens sp.]|nr:hypothetical protein [Caproiciproducens sp.]
MRINIPPQVEFIIKKLTAMGYEAYLVGGCVRDSILGLNPNDWDITTSALPNEIKSALSDCKLIETGVKHGTITVLIGQVPVEVTTYRVDGKYSDNRHPDDVRFTRSLKEDLARRDFTINALAYNHADGMIDCFGGAEDILNKQIRCVGEPTLRFQEDGLRILRALRFSSVLSFTIEENTSVSILKSCDLLDYIARERINCEFTKLLCGKNAEGILRDYRMVIEQFLPEISPMAGFEQHNTHHIYDVWEHTLKSVGAVEATPVLRLTTLLHDIGKPYCYTQDEKGVGHFYGHGEKSTEMAKKILVRLKYDSVTIDTVTELVKLHDLPLSAEEKLIRHRLNQLGQNKLRLLLKVKAADTKAQNPIYWSRLDELHEIEAVVDDIIARSLCFSLKDLQVDGADILSLGIPKGPEIGRTLSTLLDAVIDGKCKNQFNDLMSYAQAMKDSKS